MDISIDCFAGGGGASTGYQMATGQKITIAINHDPEALSGKITPKISPS